MNDYYKCVICENYEIDNFVNYNFYVPVDNKCFCEKCQKKFANIIYYYYNLVGENIEDLRTITAFYNDKKVFP